jgi:plastocyanin
MSEKMSGSTKAVLVLVLIIAIVIPIALSAVLINGSFALPAKTTATSSTSTTSSASGPGTATVVIPAGAGGGLNFTPATATVIIGVNNTIIFTNQDTGVTHNIDFQTVPTGSNVTAGYTSPNLKSPAGAGQTWSVTLTTPGTYTYVCDYHNWMKGTITVKG